MMQWKKVRKNASKLKKQPGNRHRKKEDLATLGGSINKVFPEELREQKAHLKKINHFRNEALPAPKEDKDDIKRDDRSGFDSDSSYESDTCVNLWGNVPDMRGGGKFSVGT